MNFKLPKYCFVACLSFVVVLFTTDLSLGQSFSSFNYGLPPARHFSPEDYEAGIQNWQMTQQSTGMLYVANNFGLLEFDGENWTNYMLEAGKKLRSVAIGNDGRIYTGGQDDFGYFEPDDQGKLSYRSLKEQLPEQYQNIGETWHIYINHNQVIFCTFYYIITLSNDQLEVITPPSTLEFSFYVNHQLYSLIPGIGLHKVSNGRFELTPEGEKLAHINISGMVPLNRNQILITTFRNGAFTLSAEGIKPWQAPINAFLTQSYINAVSRLSNNLLVFGTQSEGLVFTDLHGDFKQQLTKGRGLNNRTVLSLLETKGGNLWVGLNNGISYVELSSAFRLFNEEIGLLGTGYAALSLRDTLYLGTNNGLYYLTPKDTLPQAVEGSRGQVYSLAPMNGGLLMGHHNGGYVVKKSKAQKIIAHEGVWSYVSLPGKPNQLLAGTYSGLIPLQHAKNKWLTNSTTLTGLNESSRVMVSASATSLWMTHGYRGAYKVQLNEGLDSIQSVKRYHQPHGFPSDRLINVFKIENENLFTAERGLYRYNATTDKFVPAKRFNELLGASRQLQDMEVDGQGNIYFLSSSGAGVLMHNGRQQYKLQTHQFNQLADRLNDDLQNITVLEDNTLLFAAKEGFIHYSPFAADNSNATPTVLLRQVHIGDSVASWNIKSGYEAAEGLHYKHNTLKFSFSSPNIEALSKPQFQYYLEPYENRWSAWQTQNFKEYTNLPEGTYTFHVRARNSNHQAGAATTYTFTINPPWYRTNWAWTIYVILGLLLLGLILYFQKRRHQVEKVAMAEQQAEEILQREQQLQTITKKTAEEIDRLQQEKLQAEIDHKNQELATQTMHILAKNEFISSIRGNITSLSKKSKNKDVVSELNRMARDIERNINTDGDWEQFQIHFDQVHGDFLHRLQEEYPGITPQELKLSSYLRLNLSSKEIAQLLNISVRGVEISRYRLRKKLGLQREDNLTDFILRF